MTLSLPWDPEMESPASILVLGGGPVGIEAAIYARFLGYFVSIFESRRVAHRMLDWNQRSLARPVGEVTTSLGHAAIAAQNPEYQRPDPHRIFTGKEYAEEYLVPLAKTDLLFDDIHFLSPVEDISRIRTFRDQPIHPQERCNDEFRLLVQGKHRGPWIARGDCVLDCRGEAIEARGMGPGGGRAVGERECQALFLEHAPGDRKFESKWLEGKHLTLVGESAMACQCVDDFIVQFPADSGARLTWIVRSMGEHAPARCQATRERLQVANVRNIVCMETLGVESVAAREEGGFHWKVLKEDDSTVEFDSDLAMRRTGFRYRSIGPELAESSAAWSGFQDHQDVSAPSFVTREPGYYVLRGGSLEEGAGAGLPDAFQQIREVFALIGGREDLDLYAIMEKQQHLT